MTKFSCTMSSGSYLYFATLIAEDEQQAKEMAIAETNKTAARVVSQPRDWSVRVLEREVPGPAQVLACGHRDA